MLQSRKMLLEKGFHSRKIRQEIEAGTLTRVGPGRYIEGKLHPHELLRVLSQLYPNVTFSHETALHIYGFTELTWPLRGKAPCNTTVRNTSHMQVSRTRLANFQWHKEIRVTNPVHTVIDLLKRDGYWMRDAEGNYPFREFADAPQGPTTGPHVDGMPAAMHSDVDEAAHSPVATIPDLKALLVRHYSGLRGRDNLAADLRKLGRTDARAVNKLLADTEIGTSSGMERRLLRALKTEGLDPIANYRVGPYAYDLAFPAQRVLVELDSWHYHSDAPAFITDRWKANAAARAGYTILRFTDWCLKEHFLTVLTEIRLAVEAHRTRKRLRAKQINPVWRWHTALAAMSTTLRE